MDVDGCTVAILASLKRLPISEGDASTTGLPQNMRGGGLPETVPACGMVFSAWLLAQLNTKRIKEEHI